MYGVLSPSSALSLEYGDASETREVRSSFLPTSFHHQLVLMWRLCEDAGLLSLASRILVLKLSDPIDDPAPKGRVSKHYKN
jgi:hypothetical protein